MDLDLVLTSPKVLVMLYIEVLLNQGVVLDTMAPPLENQPPPAGLETEKAPGSPPAARKTNLQS